MYYIFRLSISNDMMLSIESVISHQIDSEREALKKFKVITKMSKSGLVAGLFDFNSGEWIHVCYNGKLYDPLKDLLNSSGLYPSNPFYLQDDIEI